MEVGKGWAGGASVLVVLDVLPNLAVPVIGVLWVLPVVSAAR